MKKALSLTLALLMCLSLIPMTALAYGNQWIQMDKDNFESGEEISVTVSGIDAQWLENWAQVGIFTKGADPGAYGKVYQITQAPTQSFTFTFVLEYGDFLEPGEYEMRLYDNGYAYSVLTSVPFTVGGASTVQGSEWAKPELEKADALGLIPDTLKSTDLTQPITRAEFAAVAVKVFENLSGTKTTPSATSTFTDTQDVEVLKAHNTGLMVGVSATTFEPNTLLNREQAATALTRVLKRAYIPGWTFATDGQFTLNFTKPATFADDAQISDWAKESVYFMAANSIILGVGENKFAPKATTSAEQAANYASATREQAIIIGVRLVENLGGKPLDFQQGAVSEQPAVPEQPTTPPSGSIDANLTGEWKGQGTVTNAYGNTSITYLSYSFANDGSFVYYFKSYYAEYEYRGKYSAADGKASFYDIELVLIGVQNQGDPPVPVDKVMEYEFGTDNDGAYLGIASLRHRAEDTYVEINDSTRFKFYKQ